MTQGFKHSVSHFRALISFLFFLHDETTSNYHFLCKPSLLKGIYFSLSTWHAKNVGRDFIKFVYPPQKIGRFGSRMYFQRCPEDSWSSMALLKCVNLLHVDNSSVVSNFHHSSHHYFIKLMFIRKFNIPQWSFLSNVFI